ncbi:MAG: FG-GAP-like repeat-containing protein [Planctomycetota bacterium]|jgi:Ca2+-binding RTX toxin-like protein
MFESMRASGCFLFESKYLRSLRRGRQKRLRLKQQQSWETRSIELLEDRSLLTLVDFPTMIAEVTAVSEDGDTIAAFLRGSASVDVGDTPTRTPDGRDTVQTEIVSMSLQGFDSFNGPLDVRVSSMLPSLGATTERRDVNPGQLDTTFNIDSFFDVFLEIDAFVEDPMNPSEEIQVTLHGVSTVTTGDAGARDVPVAPGDTMSLTEPFDLFLDPFHTMPAGFTVEELDLTFEADFTSIEGQKWHDLNSDGVKDPGEPGLDDWIVVAIDLGRNVPVDAQVTRSIDVDGSGMIDPDTEQGLFEFTDLPPGRYFITEMQQSGWSQTFPLPIPAGEFPGVGPGDNWLQFTRQANDSLTVGMLATFDWDSDGSGDEVVFLEGDTTVVLGDYDGGTDSVAIEVGEFDMFGDSTFGPVHIRTGDPDTNNMVDGPLHLGGQFVQDPLDPALADSFFDIFVELDVGNVLGGSAPDPSTVWTNSTPIRVEASIDRLAPTGRPYQMTNASPVEFFDQSMEPQAQIVDMRFTTYREELFDRTVGYIYDVTQGQQISNVLFGNRDLAAGPFGNDYGDAPDGPYPTLAANNGASHAIDGKHFLGFHVDGEDDGQPDPLALGDDLNDAASSFRTDDEDGVLFVTPLVAGQSSDIVVIASFMATGDMLLNGWIDFDGNGDWLGAGEQVFQDQLLIPGANLLSISVPEGMSDGTAVARFRVSTEAGLSFDGPASDGEVEDYLVSINAVAPPPTDFGDAPDPFDAVTGEYPTLAENNGAFHLIDGSTVIGNFIDGEPNGQPSPAADGDDVTGLIDDEDGVTVTRPLAVGEGGVIEVSTLTGGFLNAWIDFNADGDWDDGNEQIAADFSVGPGRNPLFVSVPGLGEGTVLGPTYARFRLSPNPGEVMGPSGAALNPENPGGVGFGEVEDLALTIYHGEVIAETDFWELSVNPQELPPSEDNGDDRDAVGVAIFENGLDGGFSTELVNQQWYWFSVNDGPVLRLDELSLVSTSPQFSNPIQLTYGDAANGDPIQVDLSLTLNETSPTMADIATSVVITDLTGAPINVDFFAYSDFDLNGSLGQFDRATVVSPSQIDVTGVAGSSVSDLVTGMELPDHYEVGMVGPDGTAFDFQSGTLTDLTDVPPVSATAGPANVAHAYQWTRSLGAAGTVMLNTSQIGEAVELILPAGSAGGVVSVGSGSGTDDDDEMGGLGGNVGVGGAVGGVGRFSGAGAPGISNPGRFDPAFAIGYDYSALVNRFRSVELPVGIGDDQYTVSYLDDLAALQTMTLAGGVQFDFNTDPNVADGVSDFRVLGIEASAAIDVEDPFGFVTQLSFVTDGPFESTQTGIPEFVYVAEGPGQLREDVDVGGMLGVLETGDEGTWLPGGLLEETGLTFGFTLFDSLTDAQDRITTADYTGLTQIMTSPPAQVTSVSPQAASHTATAGTNISATFDQTITGSTVTDQTFVVQALQTGRLLTADGNMLSTSGAMITLDPAMDFKAGELVHVTATAGIEGPGEIGVAPHVWQFTVASSQGSGEFEDSGQDLGVGTSRAVALGDLDGDGDLDAFLGTDGANEVLLQDVAGDFNLSQTLTGTPGITEGLTTSIALGDLDGDGDLDAVEGNFSNAFGNMDYVWINQGGAQAGTPGMFAIGVGVPTNRTTDIALGDVDGDGDLDLFSAVSNQTGNVNRLWLNNGDGTFGNMQDIGFAGRRYAAVAMGDLDNDGDLDLYVGSHFVQFETPDVTEDEIWLNDGTGTFTLSTNGGVSLDGSSASAVALGDVDGDGDLDAFVGNSPGGTETGEDRIWINQGGDQGGTPGEFADSGQALGGMQRSSEVRLSDLDGDGDLDAVVSQTDASQQHILLNDGNGNFASHTAVSVDLAPYSVDLGDVDSDGDLDLFSTTSGRRNLFLNLTSGPADVTLPAPGSYEVLVEGSDTVVRVASGAELLRRDTSLVTSLTINGSAGDDTLTVDFSGGSPIPLGGLNFDGAEQTDGDALAMTGGTVASSDYQFDNANDGAIDLDGQTITFTGLEPITDDLSVTDRVFTYSSADDDIVLDDDGVAGNNISRISSAGTAETVDFTTPTGSLTINAGAGEDELSFVATDSMFNVAITANGDSEKDLFHVAPHVTSTITVDGGTPSPVTGPLDQVTFDLMGVGTPQLIAQSDLSGELASTTHGTVTYANVRSVSAENGQFELIVDTVVLGEEDGAADEVELQLIHYDLIPVAIGNTSSPDPFVQFYDAPAINNEGQVAFQALRSGMPENLQGVFVADVDGFETAALEGQTITDGTFTGSFSDVSLADSGLAAFRAGIELAGMPGTFGSGVFGGDGSSITTIGPVASNPFAGPNYFSGSLNENGDAVLAAGVSFVEDLYVNTGSGPVKLYDGPRLGEDFGAFFGPDINNSGVISSIAGARPGVFRFVVTGNGGSLTTVADTYDPSFNLKPGSGIQTNTSINDSGTVAFVARADTVNGEYGVYTGNGGALSLVADSSGDIGLFSSYGPSINDSGTVAFTAILNGGDRGLYTGPDLMADKVVEVGDLLAGGTVTYVESGRFAINDSGEIAFSASLGGGREVIAVAEPITPHLQIAVNGLPVFQGEFTGVSSISVNGSGDDDELIVDTAAGDPVPDGGLSYDGGGQMGAGDALELEGPADTVTHTFTSSSSGSADLDGQVISYTGLEPIVDMTTATHRVFTFGATDDDAELSDGLVNGDDVFRLTSVASSELLDFSLPTSSLTINLGDGADSLLISADDLDSFVGSVTVNGDGGTDSIDAALFTLPATINGGDDDDTLSGGAGNDSVDGGAGTDLLVQAGDTDFTLSTTQLISTLTGTDSLTSIDLARLTGGAGDNAIDVSAFGGSTTLTGGDGNDTLTGSAFADVMTGSGGNDVLTGGDGNDTLNGGSGKDELIGGAGDDVVQGQGGTGDTLDGGDGDDTLNGGSGNDLIRETFAGNALLTNSAMTGRGNDTVISAERTRLTGGGAAQSIDVSAFFTAGLTSATLLGGGGDDTLMGSPGSDVMIGAGGSDLMIGSSGHERMLGGSGSDTLIGGPGNDRLKGLGGSGDRLSGGDGDDTLNGGRGVDRLIETGDVDFTLTTTSLTGLGTDVIQAIEVAELNGGAGDNVIDVSAFTGFRGFTLLRGNDGDDSIVGSAMNDVINGGDGNDTLLGKLGNDTLNGGDGNDGLSGFTGDDVLNGERGFDRGFGGEGNDTLTGGNARDTLVGGDGDDSLAGNAGTDTLVGGTGNNDASMGDVFNDATAVIDEAFMLDPLPGWVDQV